MEINATKKVVVNAKTLKLHLKVRDNFQCTVEDQDGEEIKDYEGYVPDFMPGDHYGDYLILDIDLDTGVVSNWNGVDKKALKEFLESTNED